MSNEDIRWQQRYRNFLKAFTLFEEAVELARTKKLSKLEEQGLIQRFEFTHELAWNVLKDYFEYQGNTSITGSRDATREAFNKGLVSDGAGWMEMIKSRNQSSHTYNDEIATELVNKATSVYYQLFVEFIAKMNSLLPKQ
ncbi:MAG: nucleotidyltransferase substrate binding protein [Bacteroidia bacterium]